MKKHPDAIAWDEFKAANAGSFDASSLGCNAPDYYLLHRLRRAFDAGMDAARKQAARAATQPAGRV